MNDSRNVPDAPFYGTFSDSTSRRHYTFPHLSQTTNSATVRMNYTFTPTISLQA